MTHFIKFGVLFIFIFGTVSVFAQDSSSKKENVQEEFANCITVAFIQQADELQNPGLIAQAAVRRTVKRESTGVRLSMKLIVSSKNISSLCKKEHRSTN